MNKLPKWVIPDNFPALYDSDSATVIEMTGKLYNAINELIEDYNKFVDNINVSIETFENSSKENYEEFKLAMSQEFEDFIGVVELKVQSIDSLITEKFYEQNTHIAETIVYIKNNLIASINHELTKMKNNGEMSNEVLKVFNNLNDAVKTLNNRFNTFTALPSGSTTADAELIDIRNAYNGIVYESAGESVREQFKALDESINNITDYRYIISDNTADLNNYYTQGIYTITVEGVANNPLGTLGNLVVTDMGHNRYTQEVKNFRSTNNPKHFMRQGQLVNGVVVWNIWVEYITTNNLAEYYKNTRYFVISSDSVNFNDIVIEGIYTVTSQLNANNPFNDRCLLFVTELSNNRYMQELRNFKAHNNPRHLFRYGQLISGVYEWTEWVESVTSNNRTDLTNVNYKIVTMGDSITANVREDNHTIATRIAEYTGATTYNCGFGACRMATHPSTQYAPFSMCELADAISTGNFTNQIEQANISGAVDYFAEHVETLRNIDFNEIDIITIAYGTNDYNGNVLLDNNNDKFDKSTFKGALRYSIETILSSYPNLRICLIAPTFRLWLSNGEISETSDTRVNANDDLLLDYITATLDVANEYHLPFVNPYYELGINKFNYNMWFTTNDGVHPNEKGQELLAKLISRTIAQL